VEFESIARLIALYAIPGIFAITLHEAAHGYAARHFGDLTAYHAGRISLNPVRHVDPIGTVLVPILILVASGGKFAFGWAKPVPVNFAGLRKPKRDMLWVAAAGPGANLFMALLWVLVIKLGQAIPVNYFTEPLILMARGGIIINTVLMVLNLLPLPPLDGGRIAVSLLRHDRALWDDHTHCADVPWRPGEHPDAGGWRFHRFACRTVQHWLDFRT
jgi:Zn-dependent protease